MRKDNKTIGVTVYFFTNNLPERVGVKNDQIPFWTSGSVYLKSNKTKGIKTQEILFNGFDEIPGAIKKILRKGKLVAVESMRTEKRKKK